MAITMSEKYISLDVLKEINLMTSVPRRLVIYPVDGKATVCIGVRRSGKSIYMTQIMQHLLAKGVLKENILYLNFFDDRLHALQYQGLGVILEAYYSMYP